MVNLVSLTTKIFIFVTLASTAHAQLANDPNPQIVPVCFEKSDAYRLAFADTQGDAPRKKAWAELAAEGRCAHLPAVYLFTIDQYTAPDGPSRVVEMTIRGERVWGIRGPLPKNVWLISR